MTTKGSFKNQFVDYASDSEQVDALMNSSKTGVFTVFYYLICNDCILFYNLK